MTVDPAAVRASLADATPDVFWTDRPERPAPRSALTGAGHAADLVVVGGGFTGLWAAIQAKEDDPSRDVVVLERGRFGVAASGRNGGFVSSSLTHGLAQGLACWPDEIDTLERLADENRAGLEAAHRVRHRRRLPRAGRDHDGADRAPGGVGAGGLELHRDHGVAATLLDAWAPGRGWTRRATWPGGSTPPSVWSTPAGWSGAWPRPPSGSGCGCTRTPR